MECIKQLKAALAVVPVSQPCTAAAVESLHLAGHPAARQLLPGLPDALLTGGPQELQEACGRQQLPGACWPVVVWLAAGLRSGLPAAARQQAHEMACVLLGVSALAVPQSLHAKLWDDASCSKAVQDEASRLLQQLGADIGNVCKQLAEVASVLVATLFPTGPTTSSSSSSRSMAAPPLHQLASQAVAWVRTSALLYTVVCAIGWEVMVPVLKGSGVFQVMMEGALLLLAQDPAVYAQGPADEVQAFDCVALAMDAATYLVVNVGGRMLAQWYIDNSQGMAPGSTALQVNHTTSGRSFEQWMLPLFRLQMLLLAKMQWDVRQCPEDAVDTDKAVYPWPAKVLRRGLLSQMVSPCVAGDLLQQRAPGLVAHIYTCHRRERTSAGFVWKPMGQGFASLAHNQLGDFQALTSRSFRACIQDDKMFDAMGALDLALLLEVAELYCLTSPPGRTSSVHQDHWNAFQQALEVSPYPVLAQFAASCGEALLSIAEYLVEDVLLVSTGTAAAASAPVAGSGPTAGGPAASAATAQSTSSSSSSGNGGGGGKQRPRAGGRNPRVTLDHHVWWAQDTITSLSLLMRRQEVQDHYPDHGTYLEQEGYGVGVLHSLLTSSTAPRLLRLLEVALRTPELQGPRLQNPLLLLPWRLPLLHVAASSPAGSRALLSAVTSVAKAQQLGIVVMSALVQAQGELAAAAAGVVAAVPGRMGQAVAQQVPKQPGMVVWQAVLGGLNLTNLAVKLMARAAALLDPVLAPLAAYLAATQLSPGQDSKPWAVEALLMGGTWLSGNKHMDFNYLSSLGVSPLHMTGIMEELTAALALRQAAAARKQAARLVKKGGGGAAEAEQLRQQLQGMWLGRDGDVPAGLSDAEREQLAAVGGLRPPTSTVNNSSGSTASGGTQGQLPHLLQEMCNQGILKQEEVLAAGDPAAWSSALGCTSEADLLVASTAVLAACKLAGAAAQLPLLLRQLMPMLAQQPWGQHIAASPSLGPDVMARYCAMATDWALLLAPLIAVLLPAQQAAELQEAAAGVERDSTGLAVVTVREVTHVLGLLGHVVAPDAPGCSYPGCCNLEGRSEAELPLQACSKCRGARYCCREHQVAHWKAGHKEVCRAAQAAAQLVQVAAPSRGP